MGLLVRGRPWRPRRVGCRAAEQIIVVPVAQRRIHQDPVRLREIRRDPRGHLLKLLTEMLDLVRMVARDLTPERLFDLVGGRARRHREHVVEVSQRLF